MNQRTGRNETIRYAVLIIATMIVAGGCGMPFEWAGAMPDSWDDSNGGTEHDGGTEPGGGTIGAGDSNDPEPAQMLTVSGPTFTLAWDSGSPDVDAYRVYWRTHGEETWLLLADAVSETQHAIAEGDLPYGTYEFAVSSLATDGAESSLHHSFDETADPEPWILRWIAG